MDIKYGTVYFNKVINCLHICIAQISLWSDCWHHCHGIADLDVLYCGFFIVYPCYLVLGEGDQWRRKKTILEGLLNKCYGYTHNFLSQYAWNVNFCIHLFTCFAFWKLGRVARRGFSHSKNTVCFVTRVQSFPEIENWSENLETSENEFSEYSFVVQKFWKKSLFRLCSFVCPIVNHILSDPFSLLSHYVITSLPSTSFDECYFISSAILAWVYLNYNIVCFHILLSVRSPIPLICWFLHLSNFVSNKSFIII